MAPNGDSTTITNCRSKIDNGKPRRLSMDGIRQTISDISNELRKQTSEHKLPQISEVEDAKCECCGMREECTLEYIQRTKDKFSGKMICGLCAEAVKEECEKNGGMREEALTEAVRDIFRKCASLDGRARAKQTVSEKGWCYP
ncbi:hypothetical protein ACHQM5_028645 [Ranunculus cassubicifolius]